MRESRQTLRVTNPVTYGVSHAPLPCPARSCPAQRCFWLGSTSRIAEVVSTGSLVCGVAESLNRSGK